MRERGRGEGRGGLPRRGGHGEGRNGGNGGVGLVLWVEVEGIEMAVEGMLEVGEGDEVAGDVWRHGGQWRGRA